jgi:hypothetical protein
MSEDYGTVGQNIVKAWLKKERGCTVISMCDIVSKELWRGPRMESDAGFEPVLPDFLVVQPEKLETKWMEIKRKGRFSWHVNGRCWVTGIDQHYLEHYCAAAAATKIPVWLFFLHLESQPSADDLSNGSPAVCPTGLFAQELLRLHERTHHTSVKWGKGGMAYWAPEAFQLLATAADLEPYVKAAAA